MKTVAMMRKTIYAQESKEAARKSPSGDWKTKRNETQLCTQEAARWHWRPPYLYGLSHPVLNQNPYE